MRLRTFPRWSVATIAVASAFACGQKRPMGDPPPVADAPSCATVGRPRPDKARYRPRDQVAISVDVTNTTDRACSTTLALLLTHLGDPATIDAPTAPTTINIDPGGTTQARFTFTAPSADFQGYLAVIAPVGAAVGATTAIDVSSDAIHFPRYGFISMFPPGQSRDTSAALVRTLTQDMHLNLLQFYDWEWRHEKLIERNPDGSIVDPWNDLFGRSSSWATIRDLVDATHEQNALAMAYAAVYAGREGYHEISGIPVDEGLFTTPQATTQASISFGAGLFLFLFDPSNPGWQQWMLGQYKDAINTGKFDGLQLDQFGPEPTLYRANGSSVDLPAAFVSFLQAIKPGLVANDPAHAVCAFNIVAGAVNGPGVMPVATSNTCDLLYSELWFETSTYEDIRNYVNQLRSLGGGRAVVIAGYSNYGEDVGDKLEAENAMLTGCFVSGDHEGFSGSGFVAGFDQVGDAIKWNVTLPDAAHVSLVFRYANATGHDAVRTIYVDGNPVGKPTMHPRPSWSDWSSDAYVQIAQPAGPHTVELRFDPGDVGAVNIDRLVLSEFNEPSVRLENAVVFASGASHIEVGDDLEVLGHEYFPNRAKSVSTSLLHALQHDYDFITAYENLLFEADVVARDERRDAIDIRSGQHLVTTGAGGIWSSVREKGPYEMIHLVNLIGVNDDVWRNAAPAPQTQENITFRYYGPRVAQAQSAFYATPDDGTGQPQPLALTAGSDARGAYVEFVVPRLEYWDVVVLREPQ